jgi:hypothetical protein
MALILPLAAKTLSYGRVAITSVLAELVVEPVYGLGITRHQSAEADFPEEDICPNRDHVIGESGVRSEMLTCDTAEDIENAQVEHLRSHHAWYRLGLGE